MWRTRYSSTYSVHSGTISRSPHWAHLMTGVSLEQICMNIPSHLRARRCLEMSNDNHSWLLDGTCVFAVKHKNVGADQRRGQ